MSELASSVVEPSQGGRVAPVCWVVINVIHYHAARMAAFARRSSQPAEFIELTGTSVFQELERPHSQCDSYGRHTLFRGRHYGELAAGEIRMAARQCISKLRPAAVCVNGWSLRGSAEVLEQCITLNVPVVLMSESTAYDAVRTSWKESVKRRLVSLCSAALVGGKPHVDYVAALGMPRERIFTGYDVVDNEYFARGANEARNAERLLRQRLGLPEQYFLASARFEAKKNLSGLLRAYHIYRAAAGQSYWKLVILGDGELRPELQRLRSQLGLVEDVLLPGFQGYEKLPAYYALASAFVHASTSEQWGLVVNEAMACGLPVLVSERCGCAPDLVEAGNNGWTFDPFNANSVAEVMLRLSGLSVEERRRLGGASREIIARWAPETFAEGLTHAIEATTVPPRRAIRWVDKVVLQALMYR